MLHLAPRTSKTILYPPPWLYQTQLDRQYTEYKDRRLSDCGPYHLLSDLQSNDVSRYGRYLYNLIIPNMLRFPA